MPQDFLPPDEQTIQNWKDNGLKPEYQPVAGIPFVYRELQIGEADALMRMASNEDEMAIMTCNTVLIWPIMEDGSVVRVDNAAVVPPGCARTLYEQIQLTGGYGTMVGPNPLYDIERYPMPEKEVVDQWKEDGLRPHAVVIGHSTFIYREAHPIEVEEVRFELRSLPKEATEEDERKIYSKFCTSVMLWPELDLLSPTLAPGTLDTFYRCVLVTGGYETTTAPIKL